MPITSRRLCSSHLSSIALATLLASAQPSCFGHISENAIAFVPVDRLVRNLQAQLVEGSPYSSEIEFKIARLYSFAYAQNSTDLLLDDQGRSSQPEDHVQFGAVGDRWTAYRQFSSQPGKKSYAADNALRLAIEHYRKALKLLPQNENAKLGLAWCLEKDSQTTEAIKLYREVIRNCENSQRTEVDKETQLYQREYESAFYLRHLLDPVKDQDEITRLGELPMADYGKASSHHLVSPIVIPLKSGITSRKLTTKANIKFDLGNGLRHYSRWPSKDVGWLVYDKDGSGVIKSGYQLFGNHTFSLSWKNGYEALASLDDNHDGQIAGIELKNLAVWQDLNFDGKSNKSELHTFKELRIKSLKYSSTKDISDMLRCRAGITFVNNEIRDTYDIYLKAVTTNNP